MMYIHVSEIAQLTRVLVHLQAIKPTSSQSGQRLTHRAGEAQESADANTPTTPNRPTVRNQLDPQLSATNPTPHARRANRCRCRPRSDGHHDADGDAVDGADGEGHGCSAEKHGSGEDRRRDGEV